MKKIVIALVITSIALTGCNTGVAFSLFGDLVSLRVDNELAGKPHIEDVFKSDMEH